MIYWGVNSPAFGKLEPMSVDAHIHIGLQKATEDFRILRVRPTEIIEAFVRFGWRLEGRLGGQHVPAYCWSHVEGRGAEQVEYTGGEAGVLEAVGRWQLDRNSIGVKIWWPETWQGGNFFIDQREQTLLLGRTDGGVWRELEGFDAFTDYNWYVPKLVKPLEMVGAGVYEVRSWYHF